MINIHKKMDLLDRKIILKNEIAIFIYAYFQNISVVEDNRMQNLDESYTNKYQKFYYLQLWFQISMC